MLEGDCRDCLSVLINDDNIIDGCKRKLTLFKTPCKGYKHDDAWDGGH